MGKEGEGTKTGQCGGVISFEKPIELTFRFGVKVRDGCTGLDPGGALDGVNIDGAHVRVQLDHDGAVADALACVFRKRR